VTLWLLVLCTFTWAGPAEDVLRQRDVVEHAAAAVAEARAEGAKRSVVAEKMRSYREAAEALEALEAPLAPSVEAERRARLDALGSLSEALAEDRREEKAREVLTAWLGVPKERLTVLSEAVSAAESSPDAVRRAIALDVLEQASALSVLLAYDAARALRDAEALELRARNLRRPSAGQSPPVSAEVEAVRIEAEAEAMRAEQAELVLLRDQVLVLRERTRPLLEER